MTKYDFLAIAVFLGLVITVIIKGGVLMKVILFIGLIFLCGVLTGSTINDILLYRKLQKGWIAVGNHLYKVSKIVFINMSETDDDENQS